MKTPLHRSLFAKLFALVIFLTAAFQFSYAVLGHTFATEFLREIQQALQWDVAAELHWQIRGDLTAGRPLSKAAAVRELQLVNPLMRVYFVDETGNVLAASGLDPAPFSRVDLEPIKHSREIPRPALPILGTDPQTGRRDALFSVDPAHYGETPGYLYLVHEGSIERAFPGPLRTVRNFGAADAPLAVALLVAVLLAGGATSYLTSSLRKLHLALRRYQQGDLEVRIRLESDDELGTLAAGINELISEIDSRSRELSRAERLRRELMRTAADTLEGPRRKIAALVEDALACGKPAEALTAVVSAIRKQVLEQASLVEYLFELSRLETRDRRPDFDYFPLMELLGDALETLHPAAREGGIELTLEQRSRGLLITADPLLIGRAVTALTRELVLRGAAGDRISLSAEIGGDQAHIEIRAERAGSGRPEPGSNATHRTRAALALAKRIAEIHSGTVEVAGSGESFRLKFAASAEAVDAQVAEAARSGPISPQEDCDHNHLARIVARQRFAISAALLAFVICQTALIERQALLAAVSLGWILAAVLLCFAPYWLSKLQTAKAYANGAISDTPLALFCLALGICWACPMLLFTSGANEKTDFFTPALAYGLAAASMAVLRGNKKFILLLASPIFAAAPLRLFTAEADEPFLIGMGGGLIAGSMIAFGLSSRRKQPLAAKTAALFACLNITLAGFQLYLFGQPEGWDRAMLAVDNHLQETAASRLTENGRWAEIGEFQAPQLIEPLSRLVMLNPVFEYVVFSTDGRTLGFAHENSSTFTTRPREISGAEFADYLEAAGAGGSFSARGMYIPYRKTRATVAPFGRGLYLYIAILGKYYQEIRSLNGEMIVVKLALAAGAVVALLTLILRYLVEIGYSRRIAAVAETVRLGNAADTGKAPLTAGDEVEHLHAAVISMKNMVFSKSKELEESDILQRQLVATLSHDIRTPVSSISASVETVLTLLAGERSSDVPHYLSSVKRALSVQGDLLEDFRILATIDEENPEEFEQLDIRELGENVAGQFEGKAAAKGIALKFRATGEIPPVGGNRRLLQRALGNLLENALRYTPDGGEVELRIEEAGNHVRIVVEDSGIGIPAAELPHVFERFYRGSAPEVSSVSGAGLGLSVVKSCVDAHRSEIRVASTPGRGTKFAFELRRSSG